MRSGVLVSVCVLRRPHSQAMGENVVELILEYSGALAKGEHKSSEEVKMVFWDFLGIVMVGAYCTLSSL